MKLPLLLALLACAAPASAGDLPTWTAQPGGLWRNIVFTDPNGGFHSLWCDPAQCGNGRAGAANLYETSQVSQVPMEVNNGALLPWNRESWRAWRTTWSTKLSHWRYDNVTREAFQGDHRVPAREQSQMYATGSLWIIQPPSARLNDAFTEVARRDPPRQDPPRRDPPRRDPPRREEPRREEPRRDTPAPANPNGRILEFTLFGETGQLVDGRPYAEKESDWLSYAEHREFLAACPQRQGVEPTDTPACRTAVTQARGRIAENMRTEVWLQGKTYQQRYREIVTNLPANGPARDNRVTDLLSLLSALRDKKYGQPPNTEHEVQLRAEERSRLGAAPAGAVTAAKTGAVLLQEYDAARAALDARDHVGLWQATNRIRREVPPAASQPDRRDETALLPRLTPAQRDRLSAEERTAYDAVIPPQPPDAPVNSPAQQAAIRRALDWLRDHPTAQEFAAITDEAARRRICDRMRMERNASAGSTGVAAAPDPANPNAGARAQLEGREGEAVTAARTGQADQSRVMDGQRPGAAAPRPGYTWPPEIIAACEQLAAREPARTTPPPAQEPPPPAAQPGGSANMTVAPVGKPINDPAKETPPLTSWNPLLNAAKGGLAGAIVGFALGGPLGMFVGALVFGGAAWGLTKVDNA